MIEYFTYKTQSNASLPKALCIPCLHVSALIHVPVENSLSVIDSKKVQVGKDQEKAQSEKRLPLQKPRWEKTKPTIRYLYHETHRKPNEQLFPNRWPLSYLNLTKNMETYIRRQQHKIFLYTKT